MPIDRMQGIIPQAAKTIWKTQGYNSQRIQHPIMIQRNYDTQSLKNYYNLVEGTRAGEESNRTNWKAQKSKRLKHSWAEKQHPERKKNPANFNCGQN